MIFTGFLPNATPRDHLIAWSYFLFPWQWKHIKMGKYQFLVTQWFKTYFDSSYAQTFDSGRTALQIAIESFDIKNGDEVLVQAYTCMVVRNAIVWAGGTPVYVDITEDYTMSVDDLRQKITDKSKVLIIQHTFGKSAKHLAELIACARLHGIKIIEDCAHSLGTRVNGQLTGTFGDIGMFSFGTDKIVSCMRGGALITNDKIVAKKIQIYHNAIHYLSSIKIKQYLLNYPIFVIGKIFYRIKIGKIFLALVKRLNITGRIMYESEKKGFSVPFAPAKLPNIFEHILFEQLKNLEQKNNHRKEIAHIYFNNIKNNNVILPSNGPGHIFLRFTIQTANPKKLHIHAKKYGIVLGNWYNTVIAPDDCDMAKTGYKIGSCPYAENISHGSINLPTDIHITTADAKKVASIINSYEG